MGKSRIERIKIEVFGTDVRYALENFDGMLWNVHDAEKVENWLAEPLGDIETARDGLWLAIAGWLRAVCSDDLTCADALKVIDLIVDDIIKYHEEKGCKNEESNVS